jgi:hypothetical protein
LFLHGWNRNPKRQNLLGTDVRHTDTGCFGLEMISKIIAAEEAKEIPRR